jgi:putative tricarboxylic transport membrane protein
MQESPQFVYSVVIMLALATVAMWGLGMLMTRPLLYVLRVPRWIMMPIVFVLCVIGPFAITERLFDVWVMFGFGMLGFLLREMHYPMAPLVLGLILGELLDKNLRRALTLSDGDLTPFFTRPISAVMWILTVLLIVSSIPAVRQFIGRKLKLKPA